VAILTLAAGAIDCSSSSSSSSTDGGGLPGPFGLDARPSNSTCLAPDRPAGAIKLTRAFPELDFELPLLMVQAPGDSRKWYVVEQGSDGGSAASIQVFDNRPDVEAKADFIRFAPNEVTSGSPSNEGGLLGFVFDPDYAANRTAYLSYTTHSASSPVDMKSVVTRIKRKENGNELDRATERTLVSPDGKPLDFDAPAIEHKNSSMVFDKQGYLFIGFGDGGEDSGEKGQDTKGFFSKILRIKPTDTERYIIPDDNPWATNTNGDLKEMWARGFRNPWRFSFDRQTGVLWAGDVGDDTYEEINQIERGGNYGWRIKEGAHCTGRYPCPQPGLIDPYAEYKHGNGDRGIIGGYVYRGKSIPFLVGSYVFADLSSGRISRMNLETRAIEDLAMAGFNISSLAEDADGELYVIDYLHGKLYRIEAAPGGSQPFPQTLSATGCVNPSNPKEPAAALIPFDVNAPLWSDGASKKRWLAIPDGSKITVQQDGDWDFPNGTVLMKQFALGDKLVETRLFVRHQDGEWAGYTYEWNDAQSDATLVPSIKTKTVGTQEWTIPGRTHCMQCHTAAAGRSLGLENAQLNGDMFYASTQRTANQLATLEHIGMFAVPLGEMASLPRLPRPDGTETIELRARAYLHINCSQCHRPESGGVGPMDFRFSQTAGAAGFCNAEPFSGNLDIAGAKLLIPGDPAKSILSLRMHATDLGIRMPPLATQVVHPEGTKLIDGWITSMSKCP